jgi:hypothetical protein
MSRRTDSSKKHKESWVEPDHVTKKTKLFRPREKKIINHVLALSQIEEWSYELQRTVWRRPYIGKSSRSSLL